MLTSVENLSETLQQHSAALKQRAQTFPESSQSQASGVEEITATLEELAANADSSVTMTDDQKKRTEKLISFVKQMHTLISESSKKIARAQVQQEGLHARIQEARDELIKTVVEKTDQQLTNASGSIEKVSTTATDIKQLSEEFAALFEQVRTLIAEDLSTNTQERSLQWPCRCLTQQKPSGGYSQRRNRDLHSITNGVHLLVACIRIYCQYIRYQKNVIAVKCPLCILRYDLGETKTYQQIYLSEETISCKILHILRRCSAGR